MRRTESDSTEKRTRDASWTTLSVQELASAAIRHDEAAYRALDRRLFEPLRNHFHKKLGADSGSLEELTTQAISEALQALATGRYDPGKASFVTFLYAVAQKICFRFLHERGKTRERPMSTVSPDNIEAVAIRSYDGVDTLLPLEQIEAMRECLRTDGETHSLTAEERFVALGRAQGKTFETLSRQLGRALDTVHRRSRRAIAKLRQCLKNKGHFDA